MKTLAIATLLSIVSVVGAATLCFFAVNSPSQAARDELAVFKQQALEAARKAQIYSASPSGYYIPSMVGPVISQTDRDQITALDLKYQSLVHRRDLAAWVITRGIVASLLVAGLGWFLTAQTPREIPEPVRS